MKKILFITLLTGLSFGAIAQPQGGFVSPTPPPPGHAQGGFKGPAPSLSTVEQAKTLRDDAWVVLEGNIVKQIGHELYEFRDSSGSINVDIDNKRWMGQTATPTTKVRIEGEVDKDWNSIEIDVDKVQVLE